MQLANKEKAAFFPNFFKTGTGEYGEGDTFIGVTVPNQRSVAKTHYKHSTLEDLEVLLASPIHEHRVTALLILVLKYQTSTEKEQRYIVHFYTSHLQGVNNWDLVDTSAYHILGDSLYKENPSQTPSLLRRFALSSILWERRIAIVSTLAYIRKGELTPTYELCELLMDDHEDLMHKACGWMLREAGKKDMQRLASFLLKHKAQMPRTMLRYAIEKFSKEERKNFMMKD